MGIFENQIGRNQLAESRITISRSRNYSLLWRIAMDEHIYRVTSDDYSPAPSQWKLAEREDCFYLLATQAVKPSFEDIASIYGFCAFHPLNGVTYQAHVCFLKYAYGETALSAFKEMLQWMWKNTKAERIVGYVPDYNHLAARFAVRAGFEIFGVNQKSWMKKGVLHDQYCFGISRPAAAPTNLARPARAHEAAPAVREPASSECAASSARPCV